MIEWGGQSWPQPPFQAARRPVRGSLGGADFTRRGSLEMLEWGGQPWPQPLFQLAPRTLRGSLDGADFTPRRSLEMLEWSGQSWPQRTLRGTSVPLCEARRP